METIRMWGMWKDIRIHAKKKHLKEDESTNETQKLVDELMERNENLENKNVALEMEVKASQTIIVRMKGENEKFKKGKIVADKVIKDLQEKLSLQTKDLCDVKKITEETERLTLEKEVLKFQKENISKEEHLESINIEVKFLEDKLSSLEEKNLEENMFRHMHHSKESEKSEDSECDLCDQCLHCDG